MAFVEDTIESEIVYRGPVFDVRKHLVHTVNQSTDYRDIVEHGGGSVMLAIKDNGNIIVERQYRKSLDRVMLELPAGKRDPGEDLMTTCIRELREETGYTAGSVTHLVTISPSCGYTSEILNIYICRDLTAGETEWDETECLDILEYSPDELVRMILDNQILDAKTVIGVLFARTAGEI